MNADQTAPGGDRYGRFLQVIGGRKVFVTTLAMLLVVLWGLLAQRAGVAPATTRDVLYALVALASTYVTGNTVTGAFSRLGGRPAGGANPDQTQERDDDPPNDG